MGSIPTPATNLTERSMDKIYNVFIEDKETGGFTSHWFCDPSSIEKLINEQYWSSVVDIMEVNEDLDAAAKAYGIRWSDAALACGDINKDTVYTVPR